MAERRTLICDVCGVEAPWSDNDSWFGLNWHDEDAISTSNGRSCAKIEIFPLFASHGKAHDHLCGAACVTRKVSEFLGQKAAVQ